jgi:hypothetical protein
VIQDHPTDGITLRLPLPLVYHEHPERLLVPLAGILLEYPVAYVLVGINSADSVSLSSIPLDVYECLIQHGAAHPLLPKHTSLLKFSCPQSIALRDPTLAKDVMIEKLVKRFNPRVYGANMGHLIVNHTVQTMDRIVL